MLKYIYTLSDPTTKEVRYVGQTSNLKRRYRDHCSVFRTCNHRTHWLQKLQQLGLKPVMVVVEECTEENWAEREQHWIKYYRDLGCNLVNATDGGEGTLGFSPSLEYREKMSKILKGRPSKLKGYRHSIESKQRMSESHKGKKNPHKGYKHTEITLRRRSESMKGKNSPLDEEDIICIRKLMVEGLSDTKISKIYNVTRPTISNIRHRRTWSWVK